MSKGFPDFDLYEQLEVSPNASSDVIQAAYRRLARNYHPDSSIDPDPPRMVRINVAFETLSNTEQRRAYDTWRADRWRASRGSDDTRSRRQSPRSEATRQQRAPPQAARRERPSGISPFALVLIALVVVVGGSAAFGALQSVPDDTLGSSAGSATSRRSSVVPNRQPAVTSAATSSASVAPAAAPRASAAPSATPTTTAAPAATPTAAAMPAATPTAAPAPDVAPPASAAPAGTPTPRPAQENVRTSFGNGTHLVPDEVPPGIYATSDAGTYCSVYNHRSRVADGSGAVTITVTSDWSSIQVSDCGTFRLSIARVIEPRVATVIGPPGTPVGGLISVSV